MNTNFPQTSRGSFSAVSTPISSSKYSLESSRRDLHNALLCTFLQSQNFSQKSSSFFRDWILIFRFFSFASSNFAFFCEFLMNFVPDFAPNSRKEWRLSLFNQNCENNFEHCRNKFWNLWKLFNIIQYYSIVSLGAATTCTTPASAVSRMKMARTTCTRLSLSSRGSTGCELLCFF